jgi:hypothetical protein
VGDVQHLCGLDVEQIVEAVKLLVAAWDPGQVRALSGPRRWEVQGHLFRLADDVARTSNLLERGAAGRARRAVGGGARERDEIVRRLLRGLDLGEG